MMKQEHTDIFGVVLAGGQSRRMGREKGALVYSGEPQVRRSFYLLQQFCSQVFVSLREEQSGLEVYRDLPLLPDDRALARDCPVRGILSAMRQFPDKAWLVMACDLPLVNKDTLRDLVVRRNPRRNATAFYNPATESPEPMCAVYEPSLGPVMEDLVRKGCTCPRQILKSVETEVLTAVDPRILFNVNTPEEYDSLRRDPGLLPPQD